MRTTVAIVLIVSLTMIQSTPTRRLSASRVGNDRIMMPHGHDHVKKEDTGIKLKRLLQPRGDKVSEYKFPVFFIPGGKPRNFVKVKSLKKNLNHYFTKT